MRTNGYNPDLTYADFVFVSATKTIIQGASMPFVGVLARKIGTKPSIAIGCTLYSTGFAATFLTSKLWFPLAVLSLACHGLAFSFVYATAIRASQQWFSPENKGLVASLVISGYGFGSLFWVPLQTMFVNPQNVLAIKVDGCTDIDGRQCEYYFVDKNVLERVPWMFLLLGGIYALMGILAVLLISDPPEERTQLDVLIDDKEKQKKGSEVIEWNKTKSLRPKEVLRTCLFYQIWFGFYSICMTNGLMVNYSKSFGLTFIHDDHYFAAVAVFQNILNGCSRVVWGLSYDRIGFKWCFVIIGSVVTVITSSLPLIPLAGSNTTGSKVLYACWMCLIYSVFPGIYTIVAAVVSEAFGPEHYQANFGLLFSQAVAYYLTIVILTKVSIIYSTLGYPGIFLVGGFCGALGLLVVSFVPRKIHTVDNRRRTN